MAHQLTFPEIEARLKQSGVGELPGGAEALTRKEFAFVTHLLAHGQMAQAAREAGYAPESAGSIASETLRRPKVFAFYRQCLAKVANNAEQLVMRVYERSVLYHAKALGAAEEVRDLAAAELLETTERSGKSAATVRVYDSAREGALKRERVYAGLARDADVLLGSLLGKLKLNVDVGGGLKGVVLDEALANELMEQRRRLQAQQPAWGGANRVASN